MSESISIWLPAEPLSSVAFAPYGQVIECAGRDSFAINGGSSERFTDLAQMETDPAGHLALSIFQAKQRPQPFVLTTMERHPLGSQAFMPLKEQAFLIAVAAQTPEDAKPIAGQLKIFRSNGHQGINFNAGVWHHPLIALSNGDFLVIDRIGPGANCEEIDISHWRVGIGHTPDTGGSVSDT